jgi:hypothetical protein
MAGSRRQELADSATDAAKEVLGLIRGAAGKAKEGLLKAIPVKLPLVLSRRVVETEKIESVKEIDMSASGAQREIKKLAEDGYQLIFLGVLERSINENPHQAIVAVYAKLKV